MTPSPAVRYRELVADLVAADRRRAATIAAAQSSYADGIAAIEHDLSAASAAVDSAGAEVTRAQRTVAHTDLEVATLWEELRAVRGKRIGPMPAPADQSTMDVATALHNAATRIERARRGGEPLPGHVLPMLFLLGACTASLLAAIAALVAWPVLLVAPLSGLLAARYWVDTRYAARLDPGGIGLVVLGGMLATAATWLVLS